MPQRIWIIRHGKSSRPFGVIDHKRPLAKRAGNDASLIRSHLDGAPELYVASSALRAMETARLVAGGERVQSSEPLYQASAGEFMAVIDDVLRGTDRVAFVGHNPAVTVLVNELAGKAVTDNVPTLGVAAFKRTSKGSKGKWQLVDYATPKSLR